MFYPKPLRPSLHYARRTSPSPSHTTHPGSLDLASKRLKLRRRPGGTLPQDRPRETTRALFNVPDPETLRTSQASCTTVSSNFEGTRDFGREQMAIRERAFSIIVDIFKMHGATALDTPVFELRETLMGKYGEDSKLIYDLADQGGEICSLRYDLTVPFACYLAMSNINSLKRYQIAKVYRRDNPSKGRYREFYQCDFDIAGQYEAMEPDFEVIKVLTELLDALNIGDFEIKLNHRKLLDGMLEICGVSSEKFRTVCSSIDKLDKQPFEQIKRELVEEKGLTVETAERIGDYVKKRGPPFEILSCLKEKGSKFLEHEGSLIALNDLEILFKALDKSKSIHKVVFDLSLARGLDYYTGMIFEAVFKGATQVGSIAAGGRYDNLVGMFSGKHVPAVGISLGIERVFTIMEQLAKDRNQAMRATETQVLVAILGKDLTLAAEQVSEFWDTKIKAEFGIHKKVMKHIERAKQSGIPWMVLVGELELEKGIVKLKNIEANIEEEVRRDKIVEELKGRLGMISLYSASMGESVREWTTATDAPFPSTAAIWQEIDLAERTIPRPCMSYCRYLVCSMFEEAASMASSIVGRLCTCGLSDSVEGNELVDIMESAGMVFVQSLKELKRTSELITELKELFGTVAAVPGQVFLTGACMQIAEGSTSTIRATFEEFLGEWKYVEGRSLLFLNEEEKCTTSYGIKWSHLSLEKFLDIVEVYAITILGVVVNDIDLAIFWTEKAELPEERRQEILRRLHSFCSAKHSSSPVVSALSQLVDTTNKLDVSGATEKSLKDQNQKHHELDISKSERSSSTYRSLLNQIASSFWSFRSIPLKCGNATLILPRGKIIIWSSLVFFVYYVLQRKRATLQRFAARQVSSLKRALIDAWQLAFSVQVNPLAAIQPVTSAPHGSR